MAGPRRWRTRQGNAFNEGENFQLTFELNLGPQDHVGGAAAGGPFDGGRADSAAQRD